MLFALAGNAAWGWGSPPDPGAAAFKAFVEGGGPASPVFGGECISHDAADRCEMQRRTCGAGDTALFSELTQISVSYSEPGKFLTEAPTWVVYKPCAFTTGNDPDEALAKLGLKRGGFYGWSPAQGYLLYETSRPGVYAGIRQEAEGSPGIVHADALLTLKSEAQQRAAFKLAQPSDLAAADYFTFIRSGGGSGGFLPCPIDAPNRQAALSAARDALANADHSRQEGFFALARLMVNCGAEDEALTHFRGWFDEAAGEDAALLTPVRRHPELHRSIVRAVLRQASSWDVRKSLQWLPAMLSAASPDGEPLDAVAQARFERRLAGWPEGIGYEDLKPLRRQCESQSLPAGAQQQVRRAADQAVADRRYATAIYLYHCLDEFSPKVPLAPSSDVPAPAATARESALRIGAWLLEAFNLAPGITEPEAVTDNHAFRYARYYIADHLNADLQDRPPLRSVDLILRVDASQVVDQGMPAREVWVGGDEGDGGREAESRRNSLAALGENARQLAARRDALSERIEALDERIRHPGVTTSGTRAGTVPLGATSSTRFWTDQYGISHRETTTGAQGGQTMGGAISMPNLTVDAQQERRQRRAELEEVNRKLQALQKMAQNADAAATTRAVTPRRLEHRSGFHAWRGPVMVVAGYRYLGREWLVTHSAVLKDGEEGTPFSQLVTASGLDTQTLWWPAGLQLVAAIVDQQLQAARGTVSQRMAEGVLAKRLVARPTADDLEALELRILDEIGL